MVTPYYPTDWTRHPLHIAVLSGNKDAVEQQILDGANVNEYLSWEGVPLNIAINSACGVWDEGYRDIIKLLLENGADVNVVGGRGGTPLHVAARIGHVDFAEQLLAAGADVDSKVAESRTPLHLAAATGRIPMVDFLLHAGASVNAVADCPGDDHSAMARLFPDSGMTPLHVAAREGHVEVVRKLIAAGADVTLRVAECRDARHCGTQGLTASELARRSKKEQNDAYDKLLNLLDQ